MKNTYLFFASFTLFFSSKVFSQPGSLDTSFNHDGKSAIKFDGLGNESANALAIRSDGRIYVAGQTYNGTYYNFALAEYGPKGLLVSNFGTSGKVVTAVGSFNNYASAIALQPDNKIVVAGRAGDGTYFNVAVVRYNSNGTLDATFNGSGKVITPVTVYNSVANAVAIQPDGKIVVAGYAGNGSYYDVAIVRYNANGSLDNTFNGTGKVVISLGSKSDVANAIALQPDGKIVVAGRTTNSTIQQCFILRYLSNGTLDNTFGTAGKVFRNVLGDNYSELHALVLQHDGKIVAGGDADDFDNDVHVYCVMRLNANGTFDNTFHNNGVLTTQYGTYDIGWGLTLQSDGKIVQAGSESFNSEFNESVLRYNTNGSLDATFGNNGVVITNYSPIVYQDDNGALAVAVQQDGKIVTAGSVYLGNINKEEFSTTRYIGGSGTLLAQSNDNVSIKNITAQLYPNPVTNILHVTGINEQSSATIAVIDVSGNMLKKVTVNSNAYSWNISDLAKGNYMLTITQDGKTQSLKFIKE